MNFESIFTWEQVMQMQDKIHTFYHDSFTDLLWAFGIIVAIIGGIVGIGIPYLINRKYEKNFNKLITDTKNEFLTETTNLKKQIEVLSGSNLNLKNQLQETNTIINSQNEELTSQKEKFNEELKDQKEKFKEELSEQRDKFSNEISYLRASSCYDKASMYLETKNFEFAADWFLVSAELFVENGTNFMVKLSIDSFVNCFKELEADTKKKYEESINKIIKTFSKYNQDKKYSPLILKLEELLRNITVDTLVKGLSGE